MARTSQTKAGGANTSSSHLRPCVSLQYKGPRARLLHSTKGPARTAESLRATLADEFRADLEALHLNFKGAPVTDIRIVWGTGLIRATYPSGREDFRRAIKHVVERSGELRADILASRSIAHVFYTEVDPPSTPVAPSGKPDRSIRPASPPIKASAATSFPHNGPLDNVKQPLNYSIDRGERPANAISPGSILHPQLSPRPQAPAPKRDVLTAPHLFPAHQILPPIHFAPGPGHASSGEPRVPSRPPNPQTAGNTAPRRLIPSQALTPKTCQRLRDHSDEQVLSSEPIVRILVLRTQASAGKAYEAFVYDGSDYAWLHIGSAAKLKSIIRLPLHATCIGLVQDLEIVDIDASSASLRFARGDIESATSADPVGERDRASRLPIEMRLQEEHKRRVLLEGVLADVCRDLDSRNSLAPAAMQALKLIQDLADAASS